MDTSRLENFEQPEDSLNKKAEIAESRIRGMERGNFQKTEDVSSLQEQQIFEALSQNEKLTPEVWKELNQAERLVTVQDVENTIAGIQGRTPISIEIDPNLKKGAFGSYVSDTQSIQVSDWHLQSNDVQEVVNTVVHEGRHAYQDYAIRNPGFHPNQVEVDAWDENFQNYLPAEIYGQEIYQNQPIEADAWVYGNTVANGLYAK